MTNAFRITRHFLLTAAFLSIALFVISTPTNTHASSNGRLLAQADAPEQISEPAANTPTSGSDDGAPVRKLTPRGIGNVSLQALAGRFVNLFVGISGSVALLMFVYGGFLWLTSAGDDQKVNKGRSAMTWAVIGLIVIFGAYAILSALFSALGVAA